MKILATHRVAFSILIAILLLVVAVGTIFWARGFKPDFKKGKIDRTGLLVVSSTPTGAQVFLDDRLTSATDTNIAYLEPKIYKVRIEKDGYTTWEKDIEIKADLANEVKALLFPLAPEIKPLTTTGAANPVLSPDGTKIAYGTPGERGGAYVLPMSDRPFPFRQDARILAKNTADFDFTKSKFTWSPDSKQLIARIANADGKVTANLLLDSDKTDQQPLDVTGSLNATLNSWQQDLLTKSQTQAAIAPEIVKNATAEAKTVDSRKETPSPNTVNRELITVNQLNYYPTGLIFSLDEEKILYMDKTGKYHVYDLKLKKDHTLPEMRDLLNIVWYPDSNHLVIAQKDAISIIETDGYNKMVVFSGKFEDGFVFAHPSGLRLIILTTLTQTDGTLPNLYAVNLR